MIALWEPPFVAFYYFCEILGSIHLTDLITNKKHNSTLFDVIFNQEP